MYSFSSRLLRLHLKRRCHTYAQSSVLKFTAFDKIIFNSVLQNKKTGQYWKNVKDTIKIKKAIEIKRDVIPVSLQYLDGYTEQDETDTVGPKITNEIIDKPHHLPYSIVSKINDIKDDENVEDYVDNKVNYDCKLVYNEF